MMYLKCVREPRVENPDLHHTLKYRTIQQIEIFNLY